MDYNVLRTIMANCVEGRRNSKDFRLNMFKLRNKVQEYGLIPVVYKNEYVSKVVGPEDIPLIAEYFKEEKLLWFDNDKTFVTVLFVREEDMDEQLQDLLEECNRYRIEEISKPRNDIFKQQHHTHHNIRPIKPNNHMCYGCDCMNKEIDIVKTLVKICGQYPCYHALISKWVKEDSISLNIRFRANSLIINENN